MSRIRPVNERVVHAAVGWAVTVLVELCCDTACRRAEAVPPQFEEEAPGEILALNVWDSVSFDRVSFDRVDNSDRK